LLFFLEEERPGNKGEEEEEEEEKESKEKGEERHGEKVETLNRSVFKLKEQSDVQGRNLSKLSHYLNELKPGS